ncbi:MAG: Hsp70 family protein [Symploca sp. SIO2G7]|nr:Hsp70 family protein [Symploca sp. SIO2G7]
MTTVAIDFGTSNTVICVLESDTQSPKNLRFNQLSRIFKKKTAAGEVQDIPVVPTLVFVKKKNELILGDQVRTQRWEFTQPERLFKAFKRDLAMDFQSPPRQIDGNSYNAESIAELFLQTIWQQLSQQQIKPEKIIFTVPVGAFERYLDWFRDLATKLKVAEVQLIDESTAAALGYAIKRPGTLVLVVDFGGGTLDLSLVRTASYTSQVSGSQGMQQKALRAQVLAKSDAYVGGIDIDTWIVEHYLQQIGSSRAEVEGVGWQNLLEIAEKLKIRLSTTESAKESWFDDENFIAHELLLSRQELDEILESRQLLEQLRQALDEVLAIALSQGITKSQIEQVLLVGGSCLLPAVQQLVISYFGRGRVKLDKPFEAVAHGALALSQLVGVDDYLHHSYAIRLWEPSVQTHSYFPLFAKGIKYPCKRPEPLTLQVAKDGQREIRLDIGEIAELSRAEVTFDTHGRMNSSQLHQYVEYRSLESQHQQVCVAHLNPPGELKKDRISVEFEVDRERVLLATVRDLLTKRLLAKKKAIAKLL